MESVFIAIRLYLKIPIKLLAPLKMYMLLMEEKKIVILIRALPPPPETPFPMLLLVIFKFDGADSVTLFCGVSKGLRSRWFILQREIRLAVNVSETRFKKGKMLGKKSNSIILSKASTTTQWGKKEGESVLGKLNRVTMVC